MTEATQVLLSIHMVAQLLVDCGNGVFLIYRFYL